MPITRQGHIKNMDTDEPLVLRGPTERFTRGQAHRLLKMNDIPHEAGAPLKHLIELINIHNITPVFPPPGVLGEVQKVDFKEKPPEKFEYDWPNNVPKLRTLCKSRGIKFKMTDKKVDLIKKLNDYMESLNGQIPFERSQRSPEASPVATG